MVLTVANVSADRYIVLQRRSSIVEFKDQSGIVPFAVALDYSLSLLLTSLSPSPDPLQILTGSSDGSIRVLYSPLTSLAGATLAVTRAPKRRTADDLSSSAINEMDRPIMAPHTLPMYKEEMNAGMGGGRGGKRQRERERHDPVKSLKPLPPIVGRGSGGRVGTSATQHVVQGLVRDNFGREDVRRRSFALPSILTSLFLLGFLSSL